MEEWGAAVFRLAISVVGNEHDAEDVFQHAFLKLHLRTEPFNDAEHEKSWLFRVAINCAKDVLRRRKNQPTEPIESARAAAEVASKSLREHERTCGDSPLKAAVEQALSTLTPKQRAAVHLFYYEGYSTSEIAAITGDAPATVRSHLHRARRALHIELEDKR